MNFKIIRFKYLFPMILAIVFLLGSTGCGSGANTKSAATTDTPQVGEWMTKFSVKLANGETENWEVYFDVSDDGKTVPTVQLIHYIGDQTPQSVLMLRKDPSIKNNFFDFSITEMDSHTTYTYEGNVTFTSSKEAAGTLNIYGDDYQFTAAPTQ